ncbi:uncharacterized protein LOC135687536 [Rhopilema esculentum]|uniref:uncharacterized protein LOC135687536 n=1 Tax=Rhopilema esculentum TaxID=499914 RepID=UPI0031D4021B
MASYQQDVLIALALQNQAIALTLLRERKKRRSVWVRKLCKERERQGHYDNLIQEMRVQDHSMYFNYFRMLPSTFDDLLGLVGPSLVRKTTNLQKPLPPQLRMAVASRYLATGESQASLSFNYSIGRSTVCQILDEVPEKIWEALSPLSVAQPNTPENWKRLAEDFWNLWGFPLCLGAIDGKHCVINCPPNSGSAFFNYKGTFSIVLMAVVDASYMFTFVDIGDFGRQFDFSVFNNSPFGESLNKGCLNIPVHGHLPNTDTNVFFYLRAFPLKDNLLRPYPGRNLEEKLCIFNYRLSRARRVVENAFGILSARWRFLRSPIQAHPEKAIKNVLASVALHNWLKKHEDTQQVYGRFYCPVGYTDYEDSHGILHKGTWRNEVSESGALQNIGKMGTNNYSKAAEYYRSLLADYFLSPQGELPWQYDYIRRTSYDPVS